MTIGRFTYTRNLDTGHVGIDTGFGGANRICVDGVWHDRARWVPATEAEWKAARAASVPLPIQPSSEVDLWVAATRLQAERDRCRAPSPNVEP